MDADRASDPTPNNNALRAPLEGVSPGLAKIVRSMCDDFRGMRDGFPDLMLARDGKVSFIEISADIYQAAKNAAPAWR